MYRSGWLDNPTYDPIRRHSSSRELVSKPADLPDDYVIATSPTGGNNEVRAYQWLQYFDEHTKSRLVHRIDYRFVFLDGHESHKKYDFINYCQRNRIVLCCFPSKLTHRLQPLDSKPFQAYKHYYRLRNNRTKRWGGSVTDKADFLRHIHEVRIQTFTASTIRHSFKRCGLWPFDPEVICKELRPDDEPDLVGGFINSRADFTISALPGALVGETGQNLPNETLRRYARIVEDADALAIQRCARLIRAVDFTPKLRQRSQNHTVPILWIHGDSDTGAPYDSSAKILNEIVLRAEVKIYKGGAHGVVF